MSFISSPILRMLTALLTACAGLSAGDNVAEVDSASIVTSYRLPITNYRFLIHGSGHSIHFFERGLTAERSQNTALLKGGHARFYGLLFKHNIIFAFQNAHAQVIAHLKHFIETDPSFKPDIVTLLASARFKRSEE